MTSFPEPLVRISQFRVTNAESEPAGEPGRILDNVDFHVAPGERVAIVGESGSGKTTLLKSLIGLQARNLDLDFDELSGSLVADDGREHSLLRHDDLSFIPQDPGVSLNPSLSIGTHLAEAISASDGRRPESWRDRAQQLLSLVGLSGVVGLDVVPRALSGGQRQRVAIAIALAKQQGRLILADEPTSALDPTVQRTVIDTLTRLSDERDIALVLVTHDLGLALEYFDRIIVLRHGRIRAELDNRNRDALSTVTDEYSRTLLRTVSPFETILAQRPPKVASTGAPVLVATSIGKHYRRRGGRRAAPHGGFSLADVSFDLHEGEALAVVGESGSGKTTLSRIVLSLTTPTSGSVQAFGDDYRSITDPRSRRALWAKIQLVSQDPSTSLDPRWTGRRVLWEPYRNHVGGTRQEFDERVTEVSGEAGFPAARIDRAVRSLSGGERQRLSIARALIVRPRILVLDEPLSALDAVTSLDVQRTLLTLKEHRYALVYISHDLRSVARIADRVLVLAGGRVVDRGDVEHIFVDSTVAATRDLIDATPAAGRRTDVEHHVSQSEKG